MPMCWGTGVDVSRCTGRTCAIHGARSSMMTMMALLVLLHALRRRSLRPRSPPFRSLYFNQVNQVSKGRNYIIRGAIVFWLLTPLPLRGMYHPPLLCAPDLQEFNDSLSVTYLATVQKSAGSLNDLADKFMIAFGHRRGL